MAFAELVIREAKATATFAVRTFKINRDVLGRVQVERLQEIAHASEAIAEVPKKEHLELLVEYNREIRDIQLERWEAERARERKEDWRYWLLLGVTILIALVGWAIALDFIQWPLGG